MTTIEPIVPAAHRMAGLVDDRDLPARHRHGRRAKLDRQDAETDRIGDDRPAGLRLPPVVDHRHAEHPLRPGDRVRIGPLARQKQGVHRRDVVILEERGLRVLLAHGAKGRRRGEEGRDLVLLDHPPEGAGVRRADRLALVEHAGAAVQQRRINDVGMADHPADVGSCPIRVAGLDVVDRRHRPFKRHEIAADVAHHALRHAGRAGSVEDVERVGRREVGAGRALAGRAAASTSVFQSRSRAPIRASICGRWKTMQVSGLCFDEADREIEQRLVLDEPAGLDAATRGQDHLGLGVVYAGGEFLGGEPAEHHRMDRADSRAGEHRLDRLRNHRHVDQDAVARLDPKILQHGGKRRRLVQQLAIGEGPLRSGDGAVVMERRLVRAAPFHMSVEGVVAGVETGVGKPAAIDAGFGVENPLRRAGPGDLLGGLRPKPLRIGAPLVIGLPVTAHPSRSLGPASRKPEFSRCAR